MNLQTLSIEVRPDPIKWVDDDNARPTVLTMFIHANGQSYNFVQQINPDFFASQFDQVMDAIKHRVKERVLADL